jgi:hypothetical protein
LSNTLDGPKKYWKAIGYIFIGQFFVWIMSSWKVWRAFEENIWSWKCILISIRRHSITMSIYLHLKWLVTLSFNFAKLVIIKYFSTWTACTISSQYRGYHACNLIHSNVVKVVSNIDLHQNQNLQATTWKMFVDTLHRRSKCCDFHDSIPIILPANKENEHKKMRRSQIRILHNLTQ